MQGSHGEEASGLCVNHAGLVPVLEWPIFAIAVTAPLAGGLASCVTRQPRWLAVGVADAEPADEIERVARLPRRSRCG